MRPGKPAFSPSWFFLQQEGYLARACLCNGLTALRQANVGDKKGHFYSAFFELSIGFERLLKLIVILDYMAEHELNAPEERVIRKYEHKLALIMGSVKNICLRRCPKVLGKLDDSLLSIRLIGFLENFAHSSGRYSNLNGLTGVRGQHVVDPLVAWGDIARQIFATETSSTERRRAKSMGGLANQTIGEASASIIADLNQATLDVGGLFARVSELDTASKHAVFALVSLIEALREVLEQVTDAAQSVNRKISPSIPTVPHMTEFFQFAWADRAYVMRKRRWP